MKHSRPAVSAIALAVLLACGTGCDDETGIAAINQEPNTRISAGPPEQRDTSFQVNLNWFGWDDDGQVSHYEVAWENTNNWIGPIFATDSLFVVEASDTCCVDPLPEYGALTDSVYAQFHTFYVRSVDNLGAPDPTPAVRSFNAKTIAPHTRITFGPGNNQSWSSNVEFEWTGEDDDGLVVSYETLLVGIYEFQYEFGRPPTGTPELIAWVDTLQYRPAQGGGYTDERVWVPTPVDSVLYREVQRQPGGYCFAVRSIDNAGAKEKVLSVGDNVRTFSVETDLDGPRITLVSNVAGVWRSGEVEGDRHVFAGQGIRFRWSAVPGQSGSQVAGFSHAVEDTTGWTAFTPNDTEWPEQIEGESPVDWVPGVGPHKFFVRAIDFAGFVRVLAASIQVFEGPANVEDEDRLYVLAVLDTDINAISQDAGIWPVEYRQIEEEMIFQLLVEDVPNIQIYETESTKKPSLALLNFASSTLWFHSSDVNSGDDSILQTYHQSVSDPNVLPSYINAGGNLLLCGIQPVNAFRYFQDIDEPEPVVQLQFPIDFSETIRDSTLIPHWAYTDLGISQIKETIANNTALPVLPLAESVITSGPNPYPDLPFDPLSIPNGPIIGGFQYYDVGVEPTSAAEVIYVHPVSREPIGVRKLTQPGVNGNTVFLACHPWFVKKNSFKAFLHAVLVNFGEVPGP